MEMDKDGNAIASEQNFRVLQRRLRLMKYIGLFVLNLLVGAGTGYVAVNQYVVPRVEKDAYDTAHKVGEQMAVTAIVAGYELGYTDASTGKSHPENTTEYIQKRMAENKVKNPG